MNTDEIIRAIDAQISQLQKAKELLGGLDTPIRKRRGRSALNISTDLLGDSTLVAGNKKTRKRPSLSAEARARIAAAQKKRWAKTRRKATASRASVKASAKST